MTSLVAYFGEPLVVVTRVTKYKRSIMSDTYKYKEEFTVTFEIEADTKAKADKAYSQLFDKNIQLGYDKWKDTEIKILIGTFLVSVESSEVK